jgi:hypothetical protein
MSEQVIVEFLGERVITDNPEKYKKARLSQLAPSMLRIIEAVEWVQDHEQHDILFCPLCNGIRPDHTPWCGIASLLGRTAG